MGARLLLLTALSVVFLQGIGAESEAEAVEQLVKDIQETIASVRKGTPTDYLETAANEIANDAEEIVSAAGVNVTEENAKTVLDQIAQALLTGAKEIKNPLKFEAHTMESAFRLLDALADKLTEILQSGSTENLYETVLATKITAIAVVNAVENVDEIIKISHDAGSKETVDTGVARRFLGGWGKVVSRRNEQETERDKIKRSVGSNKRVSRQETHERKREWCVGWSKRGNKEEERDVDKRKWCVGRPSKRQAQKREWCVGWGKRDDSDVNKRRWCVGNPKSRSLVV